MFTTGDWRLSLQATDTDAWPEIQAENMFNDPPPIGYSFVTVPVTYTYTGTDVGQPWIDVDVEFLGADGIVYNRSGGAASCGVLPNDEYDLGDMYPGSTATANTCAVVPAGAITGGLWRVRGSWDAAYVFAKIG